MLDGAHQRGIGVILGTPTYAAPPWLARRYPEIAGETATGQRMPWGGRQEIDYTHPAFRFHAERVIRKIIARYADHPAVIGYQVDNEPGMLLFHNHGVFQRFVDELRHTYGDGRDAQRGVGPGLLVAPAQHLGRPVDARRQLPAAVRPCLAPVPGQADHRVHRLAGRHRPRVRPATTSSSPPASPTSGPAVDDANLTRAPRRDRRQPLLRDAGRARCARAPAWLPQGWTTVRCVESVPLSADRMYASKQAPFLITETNAGAIGGSVDELPRLRRPVAAGRLGVRRPRRAR